MNETSIKYLDNGIYEIFDKESYREYLYFCVQFKNYMTKNIILIYIQNPLATQVAGEKVWQRKYNRQLKPNAESITLLLPALEEETFKFKEVNGYDISQTTGPDILNERHIYKAKRVILSAIREVSNCNIVLKDRVSDTVLKRGSNGYYVPSRNQMVLAKSLDEEDHTKALLRNFAKSMCELENTPNDNLVIESVSFMLALYFGLPCAAWEFNFIDAWANKKETELLEILELTNASFGKLVNLLEPIVLRKETVKEVDFDV
ncbi:MAG: hypothetical protein RR162_01165 [Oscillospiraceae bacterium]